MKDFKSYSEQIDLLKSRGLKFKNEDYARKILKENNYYFLINGYKKPFLLEEDRFIEGTYFDMIYRLYLFDRNISALVFKEILKIENNIKSIFAHLIAEKYGKYHDIYLKLENFTDKRLENEVIENRVIGLISKIKEELNFQLNKDNHISHYSEKYDFVPPWVLFRVLNFGTLSKWLSLLKQNDLENLIKEIETRQSPKYLKTSLRILNIFRNESAHLGRIYNLRTIFKLSKNDIPTIFKNEKDDFNDLFSLIIIFRELLNHEDFLRFIQNITEEIEILEESLINSAFINIKNDMGFPVNWEKIGNL
jgi:abortive infection bacteriophage resistance protein